MNVHKNARLTPRGRVLLVERIERGVPIVKSAAAGVSRQTAWRWLCRYRAVTGCCPIAVRRRIGARIGWERIGSRRSRRCGGNG